MLSLFLPAVGTYFYDKNIRLKVAKTSSEKEPSLLVKSTRFHPVAPVSLLGSLTEHR